MEYWTPPSWADEQQRQLDYIATRLAQADIEPADHALMTNRRKRILEKYNPLTQGTR